MVCPVHVMMAGMSEPRMVSLRLTTEFSEKKMLSVASVTMNGGSLSRVTSRPLIAPIASAAQEADDQREAAGQPGLRGQVGHDDRGEAR